MSEEHAVPVKIQDLRGHVIVSCQPVKDRPLDRAEFVVGLALAALEGGAAGIRIESPRNVQAVRAATGAPIIGLVKRQILSSPVFITPEISDVQELVGCGADIVQRSTLASTWWERHCPAMPAARLPRSRISTSSLDAPASASPSSPRADTAPPTRPGWQLKPAHTPSSWDPRSPGRSTSPRGSPRRRKKRGKGDSLPRQSWRSTSAAPRRWLRWSRVTRSWKAAASSHRRREDRAPGWTPSPKQPAIGAVDLETQPSRRPERSKTAAGRASTPASLLFLATSRSSRNSPVAW